MSETHPRKSTFARRSGAPRPLSATIGGVARRALGKRGFAEAGLITDWESIVGRELAAASQPEQLSFPPGRRNGGTLKIRVAGGVATEIQHLEPVILERINGHFGYAAVARLVLLHAPLANSGTKQDGRSKPGPTARPPDSGRVAEIESHLAKVDDPEIRAALARLGRAMLADPVSDD